MELVADDEQILRKIVTLFKNEGIVAFQVQTIHQPAQITRSAFLCSLTASIYGFKQICRTVRVKVSRTATPVTPQ